MSYALTDTSYLTSEGISPGVLQYVYYLVLIIAVVMLILVLVNYTITPIFRLNPGDAGIISLPGSDDSIVYWKDQKSIIEILDTSTRLGTITQNWSFMLDIQVDNPTANTGSPRILFSRGEAFTTGRTGITNTILTVNPNFNVCVYLHPLINDLYVSLQTLNSDNSINVKTINVPNIPVGKAIRIGVFAGSKVLEVYVNGYLLSNKAFPNTVRSVVGPLRPPISDILTSTAQVSNLRIWPRPVNPAEFRSYGSPSSSFEKRALPDTCLVSS
jgi:hypothetical protein